MLPTISASSPAIRPARVCQPRRYGLVQPTVRLEIQKFATSTLVRTPPMRGDLASNTPRMRNICRMLASVPSVRELSHIVICVIAPKRSMISPTRVFSK